MGKTEDRGNIEEINEAFEKKQFEVYLLPKCDLTSKEICGVEVSVKWNHPQKGVLNNDEFSEMLEKNNQLSRLDYYVWEKVCQMLCKRDKKKKKQLFVTIPVSSESFYGQNFMLDLQELLIKYGLSEQSLHLEITEKTYLQNIRQANRIIKQLHLNHFKIILSDFESGYLALNTLKQIQVDALKVDLNYRSLIKELENDEIVLVSLIKMFNWLGMSVIGEEVDNRHQYELLEGAGCDIIQGDYFSKSLTIEEYEKQDIEEVPYLKNKKISKSGYIIPKYNMSILVIDDDPMSCDILREIFQNTYHVHACASGKEGIEYLRKNTNRVKLVLIDNFMPGMSGIEFLRMCKQDEVLNIIPQIMITSSENEQDQIEAFEAGAYDYITKPFTQEIVVARVNHVMSISRRTSIFDVIEQKYNQKPELDTATQLLSKMTFKGLAERLIETLSNEQHALMVIDIDDFKQVNDQYGHLAGDNVIRCVADELTKIFRKTDLIGRFGGDEFIVLMSKIKGRDMAKIKAAEVIKVVLLSCVKKFNISTSLSIGLAFYERQDTIESLFLRADHALYEAKNSGKGKAVTFGEKVPPIINDDKQVVLIYSKEQQIYSTIALTYGSDAAFVMVQNLDEVKVAFEKLERRIRVICFDMMEQPISKKDDIYRFVLKQGENSGVLMLAICKEGDMHRLKEALELNIHDVLVLPPPIGAIERILSRTLMEAELTQ